MIETTWGFLTKLKLGMPSDPTLGRYLKEMQYFKALYSHVDYSTIHNSQELENL